MNLVSLLFSFRGRITRLSYWMFSLAVLVIILVPAMTVFGGDPVQSGNYIALVSLLILYPSLAVQAKRWHDRDKSAWWILINFLPLIGGLWALVENGFLSGTAGDNRFGTVPR